MSFADEMRIFDESGNRLYLDETERNRFINAVKQIDSPEKRLFAEVIFWTGCRLMEAAELTANSIQVENKAIVFRTLKRRVKQRNGKNIKPHFRVVPVPVELIESTPHRPPFFQRTNTRCDTHYFDSHYFFSI